MIQAPNIRIRIGGLPEVECYRPERAEGRVDRYDVADHEHFGMSGSMLRDWFESQGLGNEGSGAALRLCRAAAEALA